MTQKSPFKFLDSFTKEDRDIFFGRDKEIEELHSRVFGSKILLVYGTSGTGKSSLINCGLANKFSDSDWLPVNIRRGSDINRSLFEALSKSALTKTPFNRIAASVDKGYNLEKLLRSVYLDHFKPIFLIFDQFEELFIFGSRDEKDQLIGNIARMADSDIQCRMIFSMREEYLAGVTEFERIIPSFLSNRIRIEKMTRQNAIQTIEGPCRINNIRVEPGFAEALLEKLNPDTPEVELTWLQIFLDKILRLSADKENNPQEFTKLLLDKAGDVKDILGSFLEEQISQLEDPETGLVVLKSFVSVKGTKRQITLDEVIEYSGTFGKKIDDETVKSLVQRFIRLRILRDKDESGRYELRHDSLALKIFEKITLVEKELLEVKTFIDNAFSNYEKRGHLLNDEDLNYIAPYLDSLFLSEKSQKFIEESRRAIHRARRRRQNIAIGVAILIIAVLSYFMIWAMRSMKNEMALRQIAMEQKDAAVKSKVEADSAKQVAVLALKTAEENEKAAIAARYQSDIDRQKAVEASRFADAQRLLAEQMSARAKEQALKAEAERQIADTQRVLAQKAGERARRLSLLSTAQNLALKSLSMEKDPEIMGLLAVQAYNFNKDNGGSVSDPVIWKALDKAYSTLDSLKHSVISKPFTWGNEIHNMIEYGNGIMGTDLDASLVLYSYGSPTTLTFRNYENPDYISFLSLSPSGKMMVIGYDDTRLILKKFTKFTDYNKSAGGSEFAGKNPGVKTAAWTEDGSYLATGGSDSLIKIWDTRQDPPSSVRTLSTSSAIVSLAFCNRDSIVSVQADGSVILWTIPDSSGNLLYSSRTDQSLCVAWNKSNNSVLTGCSNGTLVLISLNTKPLKITRFSVHKTGIDHISFSNDFTLLATSAWDKAIKIYHYFEYFERANTVGGAVDLDNLPGRTRSLLFSSDKKLYAGLSDKTLRIWETSPEKLVSLVCSLVKRDMTASEWIDNVGAEINYEKTCR